MLAGQRERMPQNPRSLALARQRFGIWRSFRVFARQDDGSIHVIPAGKASLWVAVPPALGSFRIVARQDDG
jgi:hypothetical protein